MLELLSVLRYTAARYNTSAGIKPKESVQKMLLRLAGQAATAVPLKGSARQALVSGAGREAAQYFE